MRVLLIAGLLCFSIMAYYTGSLANCQENEDSRPRPRCHSTSSTKPPIQCDKPHEKYECGSACQTRCIRLNCPCPIINIRCNDGCFCVEGYARDQNDVCIPAKNCTVPPNCSAPEPGYGPAP